MKKTKFPILLKVILLGIGVSILTAGAALTVSYFNQKKSAENFLIDNIDYSLDAIDDVFTDQEDPNTAIYVEYLTGIKTYVKDIYDSSPAEDKPSIDDFKTFEEFADFYKVRYPWIYPHDPRMGFLPEEEASFKVKYYTILNLLGNFQMSSAGQSVFISYIDDANNMVFMADSRMDDSDRKPNDYFHVPGYFYQIQDSDYFDDSHHTNHRGYILNGFLTRFTPIYTLPNDEGHPQELIATVYIQYDLSKVSIESQNTLFNELLILGLSSLALIAIYTAFSYLLFVRNINKLSKSSSEIRQKLVDKNMNEIVDISVKSNDEMETLAESFVEMERAIINYVDIIHKETQEKERTNAELSVASKIQLDSLPANKFEDGNTSIRTYIKTAKEVGGDFYDYFYLDDHRLAVLVSDVSGKGIPASLFMMKGKELLKYSLASHDSLSSAIKHVNNRLSKNNKELLFITSFIGIIDFKKNEIRYINAGHEKPYIVNSKGVHKLDGESNVVLGVEEDYPFVEESHPFNKGDLIFMFTDGLNESINHSYEEFGYQRIEENLSKISGKSLDDVVDNINKSLEEFVSGEEQFDDVTILIAKYIDSELKLHYEKKDYEIITDIVDKFNQSFPYVSEGAKASAGIVIDELVNNLISYEKRKDLVIDVEFKVIGSDLRVRIISNGDDYDPFANHKEKYLEKYHSEIKEGGFGLSIIKDLAKSYSYGYKNKHSIVEVIL